MGDFEFVQLEFIDIFGLSRSLFTTKDECFEKQTKGFEIAIPALLLPPADLPNLEETGFIEETAVPNGFFYPDLSTLKQVPWSTDVATVFGDFRTRYNDTSSDVVSICSRGICKTALGKLKNMGFAIYGSFENEFFALEKETKAPFFTESTFLTTIQSDCQYFIKEIFTSMSKLNITPLKFHAECFAGCLEITHKPHYGIEIADSNMRFKHIIKEIGKKHELILTTMTQPDEMLEPALGHFNHSIWSIEGQNLFYDGLDEHKLSQFAKHWIAGLQYHSNALFGLLLSTPNCLEKVENLTYGYAYSNIWGLDNRSVGFRVKTLDASDTYIENRFMRSAFNPYLVVAGHIMAGLDGVTRKLELQKEPYQGRAELFNAVNELPKGLSELPKSFDEALKCLEASELFNKKLGKEFIKCFVTVKRKEMEEYEKRKEKGEQWKWAKERYLSY